MDCTVRGSNPGGGEIFRPPDRPWGPPSLLYNGYRVFPEGKVRPGRAADHSPPSSGAVKEEQSYTFTHHLGHTGPVMDHFTFYHYIYSYYVEHYVSLASAGPSQTRNGRIAMSHQLYLASLTMLLVPCMSVKVLSTYRSNTMHIYQFKNSDTHTVKLHSDMFRWRPTPSSAKSIPQTERHRYFNVCLVLHTQIHFMAPFLVYFISTSQIVDNKFSSLSTLQFTPVACYCTN